MEYYKDDGALCEKKNKIDHKFCCIPFFCLVIQFYVIFYFGFKFFECPIEKRREREIFLAYGWIHNIVTKWWLSFGRFNDKNDTDANMTQICMQY